MKIPSILSFLVLAPAATLAEYTQLLTFSDNTCSTFLGGQAANEVAAGQACAALKAQAGAAGITESCSVVPGATFFAKLTCTNESLVSAGESLLSNTQSFLAVSSYIGANCTTGPASVVFYAEKQCVPAVNLATFNIVYNKFEYNASADAAVITTFGPNKCTGSGTVIKNASPMTAINQICANQGDTMSMKYLFYSPPSTTTGKSGATSTNGNGATSTPTNKPSDAASLVPTTIVLFFSFLLFGISL